MKFAIYLSALLMVSVELTGCQTHITSAASPNGSIHIPNIPSRDFSITDFGAMADGKTDNGPAIARAIQACTNAGGGHVIIPAGHWFSGPIHLRSRIDFHLNPGALILFSRNYDDYPLIIGNYEGHQAVICTSPLSGDQLEDVSITGEGVIDGQGEAWWPIKKTRVPIEVWNSFVESGGEVDPVSQTWYPTETWLKEQKPLAAFRKTNQPLRIQDYQKYRDMLRPPMVCLSNVKHLLLDGVTFRNSPSWNIHLLYSDDITVRNVTIFNPYYAPNGDGIDIDSCRNVSLTDSNINAGDDVICLKSGRDAEGRLVGRPTEDVTIARCSLGHGHGGIAIGSEMSGGVRNVEVYDCTFNGTDDAIRLKTVRGRGGVVENINIHDVQMWDIKNACIVLDMYYMVHHGSSTTNSSIRGAKMNAGGAQADEPVAKPLSVTQELPEPIGPGTPQFRRITIRNLVCHGANIAVQLRGLPELPAQNITIEHASISSNQGGSIVDADRIWLRDVHITAPAVPGFEIQNATNVSIEDADVIP